MTGARVEILLGVAGPLTPLLAAPIGSTLHNRFHKPLYDYYPNQEQVCDHDRRIVLKELEIATRTFQDINSRLIACKLIGTALKDQEKTGVFLDAVERKIGNAKEDIVEMLGSVVTAKLPQNSANTFGSRDNSKYYVKRGVSKVKSQLVMHITADRA
jgi:hypothetical protein